MSLANHKRLSLALGILSVTLLVLWLAARGEMNRNRADLRYAKDIIGRFNYQRDLALKGDLPETIQYLEQLHFPEGQPSPFTGSLSNLVETQRRRAVHGVIVYLRAKTGKDFGEAPEAWIRERGKN